MKALQAAVAARDAELVEASGKVTPLEMARGSCSSSGWRPVDFSSHHGFTLCLKSGDGYFVLL